MALLLPLRYITVSVIVILFFTVSANENGIGNSDCNEDGEIITLIANSRDILLKLLTRYCGKILELFKNKTFFFNWFILT